MRRDLLALKPIDPYLSAFYDAALISRGWFDPDSEATGQIFRTMIDRVITGQTSISDAVEAASKDIGSLLRIYQKR